MILRAGAVVIIALAVGGSSRAQIKVDIDLSVPPEGRKFECKNFVDDAMIKTGGGRFDPQSAGFHKGGVRGDLLRGDITAAGDDRRPDPDGEGVAEAFRRLRREG